MSLNPSVSPSLHLKHVWGTAVVEPVSRYFELADICSENVKYTHVLFLYLGSTRHSADIHNTI